MAHKRVDSIIIGSGQGGVPLAEELSSQGEEVVIFERSLWGGCCLNFGCTPSKMLLASAHAASQARTAERLGVTAEVEINFTKVMERLQKTTSSWSQGVKERLQQAGVILIKEEASFTSPKTISSETQTFEADKIIINTGKSPLIPPIDGIDDTPFLTYETIWFLEEQPKRMIIIGAGYVGCELGQAFARLGTEVHLIGAHDRPLPKESEKISTLLQNQMEKDGVHFYFNKYADKVEYDDHLFRVWRSGEDPIEAEFLLLATGRKPNTKSLHPENGNINLDEKWHIIVNDHFETSAEDVYAIGDVTGQPAFTHVSWEDYRRLSAIFQGEDRKQMDRVLGYAIFTQPQVGRAGLSLEQAQEQGFKARLVELPLEQVARATEVGFTTGLYQMVVNKENDKILGATLVSPNAGELVHVFIDLMEMEATWHVLARAVHIHPTFAEGLPTLARKLAEK